MRKQAPMGTSGKKPEEETRCLEGSRRDFLKAAAFFTLGAAPGVLSRPVPAETVPPEPANISCFAVGLILAASLLLSPSPALSGETAPKESRHHIGSYAYGEDGIRLTTPKGKFTLKIGGKVNYDFGEIDADAELREAFPGLDGSHSGFRRLSVAFLGRWEGHFEFKTEIDFAEIEDVKDNWVRFLRGPVLPYFTLGHIKEPFSLEMLTGGNTTTFMEVSLPTRTFGPFRNIGVTSHGTWKGERMTWAAGLFYNTGSLSEPGQGTDRISDANGFDLTGRVTWVPVFKKDERKLAHLGLSYSHRFRDVEVDDPDQQLRTRPESRLTDDRLVDSGRFSGGDADVVVLEAAAAQGPFSLQAEYFHLFQNVGETLDFNGWYLFGSWILTGESRRYNTAGGVFTGVRPKKNLSIKKRGWGALELALRYSFVDLNDGPIQGGKERNLSAGINWYLTHKHRVMVNYIKATVKDRADPPVDDGEADIVMCRFQLAF